MDIHEEPTVSWRGEDTKPGQGLEQSSTLPEAPVKTKKASGISRRKLVIGLAGAGVAVGGVGGGLGVARWLQQGGLNSAQRGPLTNTIQIGHLLRRAGFAVSSEELAIYSALDYKSAVDRLINYQQVSDDAMETRLNALNLDLNLLQNQQRWWLLRMAWTQRPLLEKMTLFWHGHLTSSYQKVGGKNGYIRMIVQNKFLRSHAFDTFDNILLGITADPAMLFYLDLTKSRKNAPNENYARELMELFTLGIGHYTQQDVFEGAAALTGWQLEPTDPTKSVYRPGNHSNLSKTYLGHTGNLGYKDVINILTNHPATPWFISRKLFTFFAYENPSNSDLQPLVDAYVKSNHNMGEVMKALLLSPQFTSSKAYRSRMKSPTEFVVGAFRALQVQGDGVGLQNQVTVMGQPLFAPPNVAGWPGDKVSALWINSGTWMARLNYIDQLLLGGGNRPGANRPIDLQGIVNANKIDSPAKFVDYFASFLLDGNLEADRKTQLVDYLTTTESAAVPGQITFTNGKNYPTNKVRGTLYLLLASPEYQLN